MYTTDSRGIQWSIDEGLLALAFEICKKEEGVEHIDLDKIMFVRAIGADKQKWLGKIWMVKTPLTLIEKFTAYRIGKMLNWAKSLDEEQQEQLEVKYIIAINHNKVNAKKNAEKVEYVTLLHELMHIDTTMSGLVTHDLQDFTTLVKEFGPEWTSGEFSEE